MKKSILWLLAAILTCGFTMTSCTSGIDNPVPSPQPVVPDEASMFVKNVLADARYTPDVLKVDTLTVNYLRLDVSSYEEAMAELLKLLPEGVAETAERDPNPHNIYTEITDFELLAPQTNDIDTIGIGKIMPLMINTLGYAWVDLTPDIAAALNAEFIIYMAGLSNDDMDHIVSALMAIMPYSKPDAQDPSHLICTTPTIEEYQQLVTSFMTTKMMGTAVPNSDGNLELTPTDNDGNSYGKLIVLGQDNRPADVLNVLLLDEDLQKSMAARIGGAFSKVTFCLATPETGDSNS